MPKTWGLGGPLCKSKSHLGPHREGGGPMMGIKLVVGSQYLGEHIGEAEAQAAWLGKKLSRLEGYVQTLVGVEQQHTRAAYSGIQNSLQQ